MADDSSPLQSLLSAPTLLALLTVIGGVVLLHPQLSSTRPPTSMDEDVAAAPQTVEARLWQDPFEAVRKHVENLGTNQSSRIAAQFLEQLTGEIARTVSNKSNVVVLSVMETASRYADDHESRLKSRYAVITGLGAAGYVPNDAEHIGYFEVCPTNNDWMPPPDLATSNPSVPSPDLGEITDGGLLVPFEWFDQSSLRLVTGRPTRVLVLWLDDAGFKSQPIKRLAKLMRLLSDPQDVADSNLSFKVIGPRSSSRLKEMVEDTYPIAKDFVDLATNRFTIYSTWATAADGLLWTNAARFSDRRHDIQQKLLHTNGVGFYNVACTDDELAGALIDELKLRDVDIMKFESKTNYVALLSERDTFYGRALPLSFAAVVQHCRYTNTPENEIIRSLETSTRGNGIDDRLGWPSWIWRSSYLKGVDGMLPTAKKTKGSAADGKPSDVEGMLRPEGDSQLDFIPRLSWMLDQSDWQFRPPGGRALRAIGVLGSDVYDKLLLLQALRREFPTAILFTTDLDARLLDSSQWKWTRNLIVASSFGLELQRNLQGDAPPFRDCYQTAQFLACRVALGDVDAGILQYVKPRVYEVGRYSAFDLGSLSPGPTEKREGDLYPTWQYHKPMMPWVWNRMWMAIISGTLLSVLFGWRIKQALADDWFDNKRFRPTRAHQACLTFVVGLCLFSAVVLAYRIVKDQWTGGAPFSLTEGNSIWPAEFLRLLVAFLGIGFLTHAHFASERALRKVAEEFNLEESDALAASGPSGWTSILRSRFWNIRINSLAYPEDLQDANVPPGPTEVDVANLFSRYRHLARTRNHYQRAGLRAILYLVFYVCLFGIFGFPFVPARGTPWFSGFGLRELDKVILVVAVATMTILIFYIADATWLCARFVRLLQNRKSQWPAKTVQEFAAKRAMNEQDVAEWIDIKMIAFLTSIVGKLIYYPFVMLLLMVLARNSWFAHWDWPLPLVLVLGTNALYVLYSGHVLHLTAERGRSMALGFLQERLLQATRIEDGVRMKQIRLTMKEIKGIGDGAFAPWSERPLLRALLIPFGGSGLVVLLQYLANMR